MDLSTQKWSVELLLSERDGTTHAEARLHSGLPTPLTATGEARLSPRDPVDVAEIGYELAAARALLQHTELPAADVVKRSLEIAGDLCIYTNQNHTLVTL